MRYVFLMLRDVNRKAYMFFSSLWVRDSLGRWQCGACASKEVGQRSHVLSGTCLSLGVCSYLVSSSWLSSQWLVCVSEHKGSVADNWDRLRQAVSCKCCRRKSLAKGRLADKRINNFPSEILWNRIWKGSERGKSPSKISWGWILEICDAWRKGPKGSVCQIFMRVVNRSLWRGANVSGYTDLNDPHKCLCL